MASAASADGSVRLAGHRTRRPAPADRRPRAPRPHARGSAKLAAKTIPLKADWDRQPRLGNGRSHHVTRTGVDRALADFIERRSEGALLVVGHRGSGKTSSVVAAANRAARPAGTCPPSLLVRPMRLHANALLAPLFPRPPRVAIPRAPPACANRGRAA